MQDMSAVVLCGVVQVDFRSEDELDRGEALQAEEAD